MAFNFPSQLKYQETLELFGENDEDIIRNNKYIEDYENRKMVHKKELKKQKRKQIKLEEVYKKQFYTSKKLLKCNYTTSIIKEKRNIENNLTPKNLEKLFSHKIKLPFTLQKRGRLLKEFYNKNLNEFSNFLIYDISNHKSPLEYFNVIIKKGIQLYKINSIWSNGCGIDSSNVQYKIELERKSFLIEYYTYQYELLIELQQQFPNRMKCIGLMKKYLEINFILHIPQMIKNKEIFTQNEYINVLVYHYTEKEYIKRPWVQNKIVPIYTLPKEKKKNGKQKQIKLKNGTKISVNNTLLKLKKKFTIYRLKQNENIRLYNEQSDIKRDIKRNYQDHDLLIGSKTNWRLKKYIGDKRQYFPKQLNKKRIVQMILMKRNKKYKKTIIKKLGKGIRKEINKLGKILNIKSKFQVLDDYEMVSDVDPEEYTYIKNLDDRKFYMNQDRIKKSKLRKDTGRIKLKYMSKQSKYSKVGLNSSFSKKYYNLLKEYKKPDGRKFRFKKKFKRPNKKIQKSTCQFNLPYEVQDLKYGISNKHIWFTEVKNKREVPFKVPARFEYSQLIEHHKFWFNEKMSYNFN